MSNTLLHFALVHLVNNNLCVIHQYFSQFYLWSFDKWRTIRTRKFYSQSNVMSPTKEFKVCQMTTVFTYSCFPWNQQTAIAYVFQLIFDTINAATYVIFYAWFMSFFLSYCFYMKFIVDDIVEQIQSYNKLIDKFEYAKAGQLLRDIVRFHTEAIQ